MIFLYVDYDEKYDAYEQESYERPYESVVVFESKYSVKELEQKFLLENSNKYFIRYGHFHSCLHLESGEIIYANNLEIGDKVFGHMPGYYLNMDYRVIAAKFLANNLLVNNLQIRMMFMRREFQKFIHEHPEVRQIDFEYLCDSSRENLETVYHGEFVYRKSGQNPPQL